MSTLYAPKYVAIDSAKLGRVAGDFYSQSVTKREKARTFIDRLREDGVYLTLTMSHICELLGHGDTSIVQERVSWLQSLPLLARFRPYRDSGRFGGMFDLALRELHAVVHGSDVGWGYIIDFVRPMLLNTGIGSDAFRGTPEFWEAFSNRARQSLVHQQYVASMARVGTGNLGGSALGDLNLRSSLPQLNAESEAQLAAKLFHEFEAQLHKSGDERISASTAASTLTSLGHSYLARVRAIGGDPYLALFKAFGIPSELLTAQTTISELRELATYVDRLRVLSEALRPAVKISVSDVPLDALPSLVLEREIRTVQRRADRVSGSDIGDGHIVASAFYLHAVEVDKRTHDHLRKICRRNADIA